MPTDIQEKLAADISTDRMLEIADSLEYEIYDYLSDMISKSNSKDFTIKTASRIIEDLNAIEDLFYRAVEKLDKATKKEDKPETHYLEEGKEALNKFEFRHFDFNDKINETPNTFADLLDKEKHIYEASKFTNNVEKKKFDPLDFDGEIRKLMVDGGPK